MSSQTQDEIPASLFQEIYAVCREWRELNVDETDPEEAEELEQEEEENAAPPPSVRASRSPLPCCPWRPRHHIHLRLSPRGRGGLEAVFIEFNFACSSEEDVEDVVEDSPSRCQKGPPSDP